MISRQRLTIQSCVFSHPVSVLLAIGAAHTYLAKAKRAIEDHQKHRYLLIGASVCLFFHPAGYSLAFPTLRASDFLLFLKLMDALNAFQCLHF